MKSHFSKQWSATIGTCKPTQGDNYFLDYWSHALKSFAIVIYLCLHYDSFTPEISSISLIHSHIPTNTLFLHVEKQDNKNIEIESQV